MTNQDKIVVVCLAIVGLAIGIAGFYLWLFMDQYKQGVMLLDISGAIFIGDYIYYYLKKEKNDQSGKN